MTNLPERQRKKGQKTREWYSFSSSSTVCLSFSSESVLSSTTIQVYGEDKYSCPSNDTNLSILDFDEKAPCKAHLSSLAYPIGLFPSFCTISWYRPPFFFESQHGFWKNAQRPKLRCSQHATSQNWSNCFPFMSCILHLMLLCTSYGEYISVS